MIASKQKVNDLCDKLMQVNPEQILIDLVQEEIEDIVHAEEVTPDAIGAASYQCGILLEVYNPTMISDIQYLTELYEALTDWEKDASSVNKILGIDPNQ